MSTAIDPSKVKEFWERRGEKLGQVPFESVVNLEENPALLAQKTELEQACILPLVPTGAGVRLLDLGAGVGQWTFRFAPLVAEVVAVEYAAALAEIGRGEATRRGLTNVTFVVSPAEAYRSDVPFDVVFVSGLFVYLTDEQALRLMAALPALVAPGGRLIVRDGTSVLPERHQIVDRYSEILQTNYSAIYRTRGEYEALLATAGFHLESHGRVFPEGSPLNKFRETRLCYYDFRPEP